jgi:hypothetical protein
MVKPARRPWAGAGWKRGEPGCMGPGWGLPGPCPIFSYSGIRAVWAGRSGWEQRAAGSMAIFYPDFRGYGRLTVCIFKIFINIKALKPTMLETWNHHGVGMEFVYGDIICFQLSCYVVFTIFFSNFFLDLVHMIILI